jgi:hypothetical protein
MSWTSLEPIAKVVPRVKASIGMTKGGSFRLYLIFSMVFIGELKKPALVVGQAGKLTDTDLEHAEILGGHGENRGKILVRFTPDGKFVPTLFPKGGLRYTCPLFEGVPNDREFDGTQCDFARTKPNELVIVLPLDQWAIRNRKIEQAKAPAPTTAVTPPTKANATGEQAKANGGPPQAAQAGKSPCIR